MLKVIKNKSSLLTQKTPVCPHWKTQVRLVKDYKSSPNMRVRDLILSVSVARIPKRAVLRAQRGARTHDLGIKSQEP